MLDFILFYIGTHILGTALVALIYFVGISMVSLLGASLTTVVFLGCFGVFMICVAVIGGLDENSSSGNK